MFDTIYNAALQTPWWVYVLFFYLVTVGIKALKTNVVSIKKLLILPILFSAMSVHTVVTSFQLEFTVVSAWIGSIVIGIWIGWMLVRKQTLTVDKKHLLLKLPGTWVTLIIIMIIFVSKYYFGYALSVDPQLIHQTGFEFSMLFISGACTGLFIGRVLFYAYQLKVRESTDLKVN